MPLPRETLKTASPEGDTEDPQYPTHNGFMARRVQKAPHASPEGGTEDNSNTPLTKVLWLGGALTLWMAAVLFRRRSTSPAPGFALRPQPASVASFRYPLQGTPVWGSRSRDAVPAPPGARLALIWAVYPPKLPGSAPPPASLCPVCGPCALAAPPCRLTCPSSSSSSSAGPQKRCVSLSAAIALRAGVMPAGPCAGIAADTLPPPVCARTGGPCGERGPAHRSAEAQSPESASTFTRCHAGCCNAGRRAPRRPSAGVELADGVIEATVTQGRRARAPRAHRCTGRSRTTLHSA